MNQAQQIAHEAQAHDDIEVYMVAMNAAEDAAEAHGAQQYSRATDAWLAVWKNAVTGQLANGGKYVTAATVAYYAERGIRA